MAKGDKRMGREAEESASGGLIGGWAAALGDWRRAFTRVRQFIGDLKGEIDEAELGKRRSVGSKSEIA